MSVTATSVIWWRASQKLVVISFTKTTVDASATEREGLRVSKRYGGESVDERRERRRAQLVDAALHLVAEEGAAALKVRAVCERARLNDRYFYESFADCGELLRAAYDTQLSGGVAALLQAAGQAPVQARPRTRAAIEAVFDFIEHDSRRPKLLIELQTAEALQSRRQDIVQAVACVMVDQLRILQGEQVTDDLNVNLACLTVVSGLLEVTALWLNHQIDADRDQVIEFMLAIILTIADITTALERELSETGLRPTRSDT